MTKHIFENTVEMKIVQLLEKAGYETYFVGGCIRDFIISGENKEFAYEDIDVTTNASPEQAIEALKGEFDNFDLVGAKFGVLMVAGVEIAQFRSETYEEGSKGKPVVQPAGTAYDDAVRRDFTMNSMYMNSKGEIIDFNNGKEDIENKVVRAIGDPDERFNEDPSRILRLFYLAARFGFEIEEGTLKSAFKNRELIKEIPDALIGKITKKVISYNVLSTYLVMLQKADIFTTVYPEFAHTLNKPQNPKYHDSDVFNHTIRVIQAAEQNHPKNFLMIMKAWCHDIAKGMEVVRGVNDEGFPNDLNHEEIGAPIAAEFCKRLQFGKNVAAEVEFAVKWHGVRFVPGYKIRSYKKIARKLAKDCLTKEILIQRVKELVELMYLDAEGFAEPLRIEIIENLNECKETFFNAVEEGMYFVSELPINGSQIVAMWPSKEYMSKTKEVLEQLVVIHPENEAEALKFAEKMVGKIVNS